MSTRVLYEVVEMGVAWDEFIVAEDLTQEQALRLVMEEPTTRRVHPCGLRDEEDA